MVSFSATCKELFHNMTTLLGKTNKPPLPFVYDFQQPSTRLQWLFQKQNPLHSKQLSVCGIEEKRMSARILWHPVSLIYTSFWTICWKDYPSDCPQDFLTWSDTDQTSLQNPWSSSPDNHQHSQRITHIRHCSLWIQNSSRKTLVKETITWSKWI